MVERGSDVPTIESVRFKGFTFAWFVLVWYTCSRRCWWSGFKVKYSKYGCIFICEWGGLQREEHRKLRARTAWGSIFSQYTSGKLRLQEQMSAIRWFFRILMERSAELQRWIYGGISWNFTLELWNTCRRFADYSLSMIRMTVCSPWYFIVLKMVV